MFKNSIKKATWLAMAGVLMGATIGYSQSPVVTVPGACDVKVLGTAVGATQPLGGLGGRVGNNGVVCMPDPFDVAGVGGNFTITTNGVTILSWQMWGDISEQTATLANTPDQSAGAVLTVNIESYNKAVRSPSESTAPACSTLARSKGRVRINYSQGLCNNFIEFDIYKMYPVTPVGGTPCGVMALYPNNYLPPIVGPKCIVPSTIYTYSVDPIASDNLTDPIGVDKYYWTVTINGVNLSFGYTSTDGSSITFTTGPLAITSANIKCCYGRCNPWDNDATAPPGINATTCVNLPLTPGPVAPTFSLPCVNTGLVSSPVTASGGVGTISWSEFSPWSFSPTTGSSSTLSYNGDNNPQQITVSAFVAGCTPTTITTNYIVNRIYKSPSVAISHTPAGVCLNAGSSYTFTVGPNALNNATTWRFPAGLLGAGIVTQNTASATNTVTFLANAPAGQYKVWALSTACPSDSIVDSFCIKPAVPVINSATCFTRGATGVTTITCTAVPGVPANGYTWNLPAGWICTGGVNCNTTNPTFSLTGTAALPYGIITVTAATTGSCACATTSINDTVWYNPITPNSITASCWNTNGAATGTTVLSVANAPNPFFGSYTINSVTPSVPYTGYTVNGQGGIVLTGVNAIPGTVYTFTITHTTPRCGNSPATPMNITASEIPGVVQILPGPGTGNTDTYYVSPSPAAPSYQWFVNGTAASVNSTQPLMGNGTPPTSVCVNLLSSPVLLGTTSVCRKPQICCTGPGCILGTHSLRTANGGAATGIKGVSVYPNPNNGEFTITIPSYNTSATAILIDVQGKEVGNYQLEKGENNIVTSGLAKGLYNILLLIDDKSDSRKIEIK